MLKCFVLKKPLPLISGKPVKKKVSAQQCTYISDIIILYILYNFIIFKIPKSSVQVIGTKALLRKPTMSQ